MSQYRLDRPEPERYDGTSSFRRRCEKNADIKLMMLSFVKDAEFCRHKIWKFSLQRYNILEIVLNGFLESLNHIPFLYHVIFVFVRFIANETE